MILIWRRGARQTGATSSWTRTKPRSIGLPRTGASVRAGRPPGLSARQFIAEAPDGRWVGTVTVLVERAEGGEVALGEPAEVDQTHVVGVFVRPEARGSGVAEELFRAAVDWSWSLAGPRIARVRLYVDERNARVAAFYRRVGFVPSGATLPVAGEPTARELEFELPRGGVV